MAEAPWNVHPEHAPDRRNTALADALQTRDMAAIAFALRHGPTVVPLTGTDAGDVSLDAGDVWTFRDPETGARALLLFSDAEHRPAMIPAGVGLHSPAWLKQYLTSHRDTISAVYFDVAGPHPMQATPDELLRVLEA
ncbi:dehydrogenase [Microbacterium candidum]|uniref:Dehydrogenase n=1 Tax=Microbacterium candidum TaxID=3041922 RepID=A0ABT7MV13_9MICO|nr:dehydrogenase [Microbacterium sp. ASV49]MDL9978297.1 dehydrogenase [Microbacterium sp. ASV49]